MGDRLGWAYLDSDAEVERATGRTVPELFAERGEAAFRAAERQALLEALRRPAVVVSVAGGAVLDPANRAGLRAGGCVVWLRARPATLAGRVGDGRGRPLLGDDPAAALEVLEEVRRPLYAEVAHHVLDVDDLAPPQVAEQVLALVGQHPTAAAAGGGAG